MPTDNTPHPRQLWNGNHHWHLAGTTPTQLTLFCCSCDYQAVVDCPDHPSGIRTFLRFSLVEGPELIGIGRGFIEADCMAGSRRLSLDGYQDSSCSMADCKDLHETGIVKWPEAK